MPVDSSIAMGYRGVDIQNPLNAFAQMQQIRAAQQNNALGQMKMDEMRRGIEEQNRLRSTLSGFAPDMKIEDQVNQLARGGFLDQARKLAESHAKASKDIRDTEKSAFEVQKLKREDLAQRMRDLASDPSDNRVTAHISAIMASPLYSDQDKQLVLKDAQGLMSQPPEQRAIVFSKYGASASDLKPQNISQNLGGSIRELQIGPMGKAAVIPGTEAAISVSPDAQLRANVQVRGQDMSKAASDAARVNNPLGAKPLTEAQQVKLRQDMGKDNALISQVSSDTSRLNKSIDSLIGSADETVKPHPGLGGVTGWMGLIPSNPGTEAKGAETLINSIKGQVATLGRSLASQSGKLGNMAVQEWKILSDSLAALDPKSPEFPNQLRQLQTTATGLEQRMKAQHEETYAPYLAMQGSPRNAPPTSGAISPIDALDAEVRAAGPNVTPAQLQAFSQRAKAINGGKAPTATNAGATVSNW